MSPLEGYRRRRRRRPRGGGHLRTGHDDVVIVALDDYESLKETAYLLSSLANARRLLGAIDRLESDDKVRVAACRYHRED